MRLHVQHNQLHVTHSCNPSASAAINAAATVRPAVLGQDLLDRLAPIVPQIGSARARAVAAAAIACFSRTGHETAAATAHAKTAAVGLLLQLHHTANYAKHNAATKLHRGLGHAAHSVSFAEDQQNMLEIMSSTLGGAGVW